MPRTSVLGAVCASNGTFGATARRIAGQQQLQQQFRSFTSTLQRNVHITQFTPTSSPALDSLLDRIRTKIILPAYLPETQRKKIYSPKWKKKLQADPIIIEIDGEVHKFRYQNLMTDVPSTRKSLIAAVSQFETAADFANLNPLLDGLHYAGRKLELSTYAGLVRRAGIKGYIYDIIDCARSARRTGLKLDTSEKVNMVLHFVQLKARDADWDEDATKQALRWAEMVVDMLQEETHQPTRSKDNPPLPGELPLYRDPMVLAAPLHLAAVLVAQHGAGEKILEKVNKLARDILITWPEGTKLKEVQPADLYRDHDKMGFLCSPSKFLAIASPLLHGLETAVKVAEPELAAQLQTRRDTLAAEVKEARESLPEGDFRGEFVYKKFFEAEAEEGTQL
ncbi:hypothetical protein F4825DRAFT_283451 [Nemania diffusa]|nr:hypothetical protein F4825DRAFT_283451 [Nemania diffusa]